MSIEAHLHFSGNNYDGMGQTTRGLSIPINTEESGALPYELLLMALGSCLYATFMEIATKKRLTWDQVDLDLFGDKREESPTFLKTGLIRFNITGTREVDHKKLEKSLVLASQYCSIYQTLIKVADLKTEMVFSTPA